MTLDEELDSKDFLDLVNNLVHIPQMQRQDYTISLADTGRYPEHMFN